MLIINADDFGKSALSVRNTLACWGKGRITSASAMVFAEESDLAAQVAVENGIETGLHLNFTERFKDTPKSKGLNDSLERTARFLMGSRYSWAIYNPFLKRDFDRLVKVQLEEYVRLYERMPSHIDGHQHMHLCMNMILHKTIPKGFRVRRNFTFAPGEKNILNRRYRRTMDIILKRRYFCTDFFFAFPEQGEIGELERIVEMATLSNVELMVHPERTNEYDCLMGEAFGKLLRPVEKGDLAALPTWVKGRKPC